MRHRALIPLTPSSGNPEAMAHAPWSEELTDAMLLPYETRGAGFGDGFDVKAANRMTEMTFDQMAEALSGEGMTAAGIALSAEKALRVGVVFACVRVIAEDVAKLPRRLLMREERAGRVRRVEAIGDPRHALLTSAPNDWMTGQELLEYMVGQASLRGTAYAELVRGLGSEGPVTEILPLLPNTCRRLQDEDWSIRYEVTGYGHGVRHLGPRDVWCLNGPMFNTLTGADVSQSAREAVALAQALEGSQSRFHANDARPSGILVATAGVTAEMRDSIRSSWQAAYGPGGRGGVAVLGNDFDFKTISTTASDGQVIENREFQIEDVCRFFRVHPWAVMRQSSSQAYASIEQTALAHTQHTIMTWVSRVEETIRRDVLDRDAKVYLKLNMNALARGALADRVGAYKNASTVYMTPNEIRALEDMDAIDDPAMDRVQLPANNTGILPSGPSARARSAAEPDVPTSDDPLAAIR